jgi:hypothetical protein
MVNAFWINMFSGFANQYGMPAEAMVGAFAFMFSLSIALLIAARFDNDHKKELGIFTFFIMLFFFTFVGALDWYTMAMAVIILVAVYEYNNKQGGP